jgi:hypothetical protein
MQLSHALRGGICLNVVLSTVFCLCAQEPIPKGGDARPNEAQGLPPRAAPTDYQTQAQVGAVTIGAEFAGHSVPTPEASYSTEDYVVVEVGFFGPPGARAQISMDDFTLRINANKKNLLRSQPFGLVMASLKDPEWSPPESASKSKTGINTGGQDSDPPPVVHMPFELQRAMSLRVQKAALTLGDRSLPQAGLIFFPYRGNAKGIHSVELTYSGSVGKATMDLRP